MELKRLRKPEQVSILRALEASQCPNLADSLRVHFLAEDADQNRKGAALVLVRSIAEQSNEAVIRTTADSAVLLLEGKVADRATGTTELAHRDENGNLHQIRVRGRVLGVFWHRRHAYHTNTAPPNLSLCGDETHGPSRPEDPPPDPGARCLRCLDAVEDMRQDGSQGRLPGNPFSS